MARTSISDNGIVLNGDHGTYRWIYSSHLLCHLLPMGKTATKAFGTIAADCVARSIPATIDAIHMLTPEIPTPPLNKLLPKAAWAEHLAFGNTIWTFSDPLLDAFAKIHASNVAFYTRLTEHITDLAGNMMTEVASTACPYEASIECPINQQARSESLN